ncbi:MAG: hypothetical protein K5770_10840 [Lachnospiraceae bacterium]|nr:hypothetical protein [Lachnospiraceae bacterium]
MIGLMMNYKKYKDLLANMEQPVMRENIPDIKIDLPAMVAYAKRKGVTVPELTEEEKAKFIEGDLAEVI